MKKLVIGTIIAGSTIISGYTLLFSGCSVTPADVGTGASTGGGGNGGTVQINTGSGGSGQSSSGSGGTSSGVAPTADANCGTQTSSTARVPADVLLVLDRSSSMTYSTSSDQACTTGGPGGGTTTGCTTRWSALTSGVTTTLNSTASSINWGLKFFSTPNSGACGVSTGVEVAISSSSVSAIETQIAKTSPGSNTPTAQAIQAATAYLKTVSDSNNKFILLATDGEPNCGGTGNNGNATANVQGTIDAITAAKAAGYPVYVIGIGPSVGNLDSFAAAGGTSTYYPATTPQALADAFAAISKAVATCNFQLSQTPPDPNNIGVYLDGNLVPASSSDGWSYGSTQQTIVINGSYCTQITSGQATTVKVLFGCAGSTIPSQIPIL